MKPPLPDVGVIALVPDFWGGPWMPRHQVLIRLARYFPVVWVEPAKGWRELWLHRSDTEQPWDIINPTKINVPGFSIYRSGILLPQLYTPRFLADMVVDQRLRRARGMLPTTARSNTILYLWRPDLGHYLDRMPHRLSCYHIDDEYSFSEVERPIEPQEARVLERVDQVIITSPGLLARKGAINKNTIFIPNGVDFKAYTELREEPEDLKQVPRPRVGYVGVVKKQLDFAMMLDVAQRCHDMSFVLVGPRLDRGNSSLLADRLAAMPNVFFLGGKPVDQLPAYTQHFDVCMMCYLVNDYTECIYPLKLHEYLAAGRPVVATPVRTLLDFAHVITLAQDAGEWSVALRESMRPECNTEERMKERQAVARDHDWDSLVARIAYALCRHFGPAFTERIEEIAAEDLGMTADDLDRDPGGLV